jgi:glyoxylase-like metal-dependent hydrolase (beta-lactamase superfamily II)/rhodanese-related sulfurtransferase
LEQKALLFHKVACDCYLENFNNRSGKQQTSGRNSYPLKYNLLMKIEQFEDKNLSHYSYAVLNESMREIVLVDPGRNPKQYYNYADKNEAKITAVIETHPHADFVSGHLQIHQETGAQIYASKMMNPVFAFEPFDEGAVLDLSEIKLRSINTPGHSPDSICVVLEQEGKDKVVFTGDTLFIGDCGRPDLREQGEDVELKREKLAKQMYASLRQKLIILDDDVVVYPAHGAGTLCGKALSKASRSTIGTEKASNWCLQDLSEAEFVKALTADQPFIPKYFPYDVDLNKRGAASLEESLRKLKQGKEISDAEGVSRLDPNIVVVDTRPAATFKKGHLNHSINIMDGEKFETWLGTLVAPEQAFYLAASDKDALTVLTERTAKIGYESFIKEAFVLSAGNQSSEEIDVNLFKEDISAYTIVDIRNEAEAKSEPVFNGAINIPLPGLLERTAEIPTDKPVVVHCAGGYRSAAGSSILDEKLDVKVFDLGDHIKDFI